MTEQTDIKAKLGLDVFNVDRERHISVNQEKCKRCKERYCLYVCPAHVYSLNKQGEIELDLDGCLECGTCSVACVRGAVDWNYPRGGFGVQYRFG
jgi:ferredoxin like protein